MFVYKSNNVARIIPVLTVKDELLYYFVCKMLEEEIAINRTENTYGGWLLGNKIRIEEDPEIDYVYKSYNPLLWNENWKAFQNILYNKVKDLDDGTIILKLDIANFYDNINLNLLEKKLLASVPTEKLEYINILMYFLRNWNLKADKYHFKSVGIPQNEFGDQSRLLANFYLQGYDRKVKQICDSSEATYIRFADDQIIIVKDKSKINDIMYVIAKELNSIGLNLNASKVREYNKDTIQIFYGIPIFQLLDEEKYNDAAKKFFEYKENEKVDFNYISSLKRFLNLGLNNFNMSNRSKIKAIITEYQFIRESNEYYMKKTYENSNVEEQKELIEIIYKISKETTYNSFHYNAINFIKKVR
ncbi:MAG: RNA-directed DNA polymerase [Clostridia bacterium]|nr:RNA-directed DNA polymerase [Clostridia bacterium]